MANDTYFLNPAHLDLARARYFKKDENGEAIETDIDEVFEREVSHIYQNDTEENKQEALRLRKEKKILPAGRPLAQAGTETTNLNNCYVLGFADDTREAISELKRQHFKVQSMGGGCVDGETYIYSKERGIVKIKDIVEFDRVNNFDEPVPIDGLTTISYNETMGIFQKDTITHLWKFNVESNNIRKIHFDSGTIETSAWHPFLVVTGNGDNKKIIHKRADELEEKDKILVLSPNNVVSDEDAESSWLLGYIVGDGSVSKNKFRHDKIRFHDKRVDILERVRSILKKYDSSANLYKDPRENMHIVTATCSNKELRKFFDSILYYFSGKDFIVDKMREVPSYSAFISGVIDSYGYIGTNTTTISMSNKDLVYSIQRYLALLGVKSHIRERRPRRLDKDKPTMYDLKYANGWNGMFPTVKQSRLPKSDKYMPRSENVVSVSKGAQDKIFYDFTVKDNNNYIAFNGNAFVLIHNTGINFSVLRPNGSICKSTQSRSSGAVGFITDISYQSSNISQSGNRSGANLGILEDWHPDLYEFITKKTESNWENIRKFATVFDKKGFDRFQWNIPYQWQMFNVSVFVSDAFMDSVVAGGKDKWVLRWKDTPWHLWTYKDEETENEYTVTAPTEEMAYYKASSKIPFFNSKSLKLVKGPFDMTTGEWFNMLCSNAWADGCPGVIFKDMAKRFHNGEYHNPISASNPCGEQLLPVHGLCCLNSLILPTFFENGKFDFNEFGRAIKQAIRGLDNIISVSRTNEPDIDKTSASERRIGLGTTGVGELLIMAKLKYSSQKGRNFVAKILEFMRDKAYEASIDLAKERGPFPIYDYNGYSKSEFFKTLPKNIRNMIKKHGIRNVTVLSGQPVGTTGTMVGYSTGCEPYFAMCFKRNSRVGSFMDGSPSFMNWLKEKDIKYEDFDYSLSKLIDRHDVPDYFEEAHEIHWKDHIKMQAVFSKYCDSSISKTANIPEDATVEDVKNAYIMAYNLGIKSTTVYRDGSKQQILEHIKKDTKERPDNIIRAHAPRRPKELECDIYHTSVRGDKWTVLVGLLGERPYEIFCAPQDNFEIATKYKKGVLVKNGKGSYYLDTGDFKLKNISSYLNTDEHRVITRLISTCLRHGISMPFISEQLAKADGTVVDFSKAIMRVLKKYEDESVASKSSLTCFSCGSSNVTLSSGCPECLDCGKSKCG